HKAKSLNPHHSEPCYLSPYSPQPNPIERLWLRLKADWFADFTAQLEEHLRNLMEDPVKVASNAAFRK
ncbi:MAG: hypothetical protein EOO39_31450, partial [Cytophagaceae bacterium]